MSDNHHVRAAALELYGKKVLTAVDAKIEHTSNEVGQEVAQALEGMRTASGRALGLRHDRLPGVGGGGPNPQTLIETLNNAKSHKCKSA